MSETDEQVAALLPPHNGEAETVVLGSMMLDAETVPSVKGMLVAGDFYSPENATVFKAILRLAERGAPAEVNLLCDELRASGDLERIGGPDCIIGTFEATVSASNVVHYADLVRRCAARREAIGAADALAQAAHDPTADMAESLSECRGALADVGTKLAGEPPWDVDEIVAQITADVMGHGLHKWTTGIPTLDRLIGGLIATKFYVVGGRSRHCKTGLACVFSLATLDAGYGVIHFRFEEDRYGIWHRLTSMRSEIAHSGGELGTLTEPERLKYIEAATFLADDFGEHIRIVEAPTEGQMEALVRELRPGLVVVDTIQKMANAIPRRDGDNSDGHMGRQVDFLCSLALRYGACVLAVSQMAHESGRSGGMPLAEHLHGSRQIVNGSDTTLMIWWPKVDLDCATSGEDRERLILDVAKTRVGGRTGRCVLSINEETQMMGAVEPIERDRFLKLVLR